MPDRPKVLLSDADVLIDYRDSDLSILALVVQHLAPVHVVRDVVAEVDDLSLARCRELGLTVIEVEPEVLLQLATLPRRLSRYDRLSLQVCRENDWICVTNDRLLRRTCGEYSLTDSTGWLGLIVRQAGGSTVLALNHPKSQTRRTECGSRDRALSKISCSTVSRSNTEASLAQLGGAVA